MTVPLEPVRHLLPEQGDVEGGGYPAVYSSQRGLM